MTDDLIDRAKTALEGVTEGPWEHCVGPDDETPTEYSARTLTGSGEPIHVLIADSPDPKFAYIVPAITGDGPTSARNAQFIAAARTLLPELLAEVERLRGAFDGLVTRFRDSDHYGVDNFYAADLIEGVLRGEQ